MTDDAVRVLRDRFVPDGAECQADKWMADGPVTCNAAAVCVVSVAGIERYVCAYHLDLICLERKV